MHALCTILAEKPNGIEDILENYCLNEETGDGEWDYAMIGGRYGGIIPIKKNAKKLLGRPAEDIPTYLQQYQNDFVSIAKVRTVDIDVMNNIFDDAFISPLGPYRLIIPALDLDFQDIGIRDERVRELILNYMRQHPTHVLAVVDYHY